jgi:hypothetical protein
VAENQDCRPERVPFAAAELPGGHPLLPPG